MPQMADIVVKKYDNTTDVTFLGLVSAAGDKIPAVWKQSVSDIPSANPTLSITTKSSVNKKVRIITGELVFPITATNSATGVTSIVDRDVWTFTGQLKQDYPQVWHNESSAQFANVLASTIVRQVLASGYAPN